jgi:hypothetical protein
MLAAVDLDDEAPFKADKIDNEVLKGDLPTKLEARQSTVTQQAPHRRFGVRGFVTHLFCETADTLGGRPVVW